MYLFLADNYKKIKLENYLRKTKNKFKELY